MVYAFDTLGYARRLKEAGVPQPQAEAHADAAREFVMGELVTKTDFQTGIAHLEHRLDAKIENASLSLTIKLGFMLTTGIALLGAILKLT